MNRKQESVAERERKAHALVDELAAAVHGSEAEVVAAAAFTIFIYATELVNGKEIADAVSNAVEGILIPLAVKKAPELAEEIRKRFGREDGVN